MTQSKDTMPDEIWVHETMDYCYDVDEKPQIDPTGEVKYVRADKPAPDVEDALEALDNLYEFVSDYGEFKNGTWQSDRDVDTIKQALQAKPKAVDDGLPVIDGLGEALKVYEFDFLNLNEHHMDLIEKAATEYHKRMKG